VQLQLAWLCQGNNIASFCGLPIQSAAVPLLFVLQDAATGVMEVDLPAKSPEGWMDYLMMTPEFQLVQGNFGSKTLLERV
jgi:hypothetical protein